MKRFFLVIVLAILTMAAIAKNRIRLIVKSWVLEI